MLADRANITCTMEEKVLYWISICIYIRRWPILEIKYQSQAHIHNRWQTRQAFQLPIYRKCYVSLRLHIYIWPWPIMQDKVKVMHTRLWISHDDKWTLLLTFKTNIIIAQHNYFAYRLSISIIWVDLAVAFLLNWGLNKFNICQIFTDLQPA